MCVYECPSVHWCFSSANVSQRMCLAVMSPFVVTMTTALGCLSFQGHLLRRLELFSFREALDKGGVLGRGGAGRENSVQ